MTYCKGEIHGFGQFSVLINGTFPFLAKSFSVFGFLGDEVSESSKSILSLLLHLNSDQDFQQWVKWS